MPLKCPWGCRLELRNELPRLPFPVPVPSICVGAAVSGRQGSFSPPRTCPLPAPHCLQQGSVCPNLTSSLPFESRIGITTNFYFLIYCLKFHHDCVCVCSYVEMYGVANM